MITGGLSVVPRVAVVRLEKSRIESLARLVIKNYTITPLLHAHFGVRIFAHNEVNITFEPRFYYCILV